MAAHGYLGIAALAVFAAIAWHLRALRPGIVKAQLAFSEARFRRVLEHWSPDAVRRYRAHFAADYVFILLYATAGWLYGHSLSVTGVNLLAAGAATWALPCAGVADAAENLLHQRFLRAEPGALSPRWYALAGTASLTKFALWLVFLASAASA